MLLIHRCQQGFTTVTLMGVLLVGGLLVAASFAAVNPDIGLTRSDQDSKQAYAAAEAGVSYYMNRLGQDNSYYAKCDQVPSPTLNAVNLAWDGTGADPRRFQKIPGYPSEYAVELLPATAGGTCTVGSPDSVVNAKTGTFRIRATGRVRTPKDANDKPRKRSIIVTLRRKSFLDFLWFTNFETADPLTYGTGTYNPSWAATNCADFRANRASQCADQDFISVDSVEGPFKTNDSISVCGSPSFGRNSDDVIELNGAYPGWVHGCEPATPTFNGTVKWPAGVLPMPQSNSELAAQADAGYVFDGEVTIKLNGSTMDVTTTSGTVTKPLPPNGVIYVRNTSCGVGYSRKQLYTAAPGCGNVYVSGTYGSDLTIGADNDIIVTDDLRAGSTNVLGGLIANNFVRIYHPVTNWSNNDTDCDNNGGPGSIRIDAAILALNHSFLTDNWYCGNALGTLTVSGAIAQKFRGTVGTHSGGSVSTGYGKDYNYNPLLRYREPPFFVEPTESAWRIVRQNEQVPAR